MEKYLASEDEKALHDELSGQLERFVAQVEEMEHAPESSAPSPLAGRGIENAIVLAGRLADINIAQAREARDEAERIDKLADVIGLGAAVVLILAIGGVLVLLSQKLYRPLLALGAALREFSAGRKESRAPSGGPAELREIAAEFNDMADSLSRASSRQLQFLAGVAHDLRNPLAALKIACSVLNKPGPLPPAESVKNLLQRVGRQVDRLNRMVGDLLDTTRIEAGRFDLRLELRDVRELVSEAVELYRESAPRHSLVLQQAENPLWVQCDPTRIEQVLNNLLSNAIKYSPRGGQVEVTVSKVEARVVLEVRDQGLGIAAEELPHIFEPFRRSKNTPEDIAGAGLGLSVARRIVEAHAGTLEAHSVLHQGSTFKVTLPLQATLELTPPPQEPVQAEAPETPYRH
jgi:signal transduction histidine kinase